MQRILLHHGWKNSRPAGHWMRLVAGELRSQGHAVWYPQFPNPEEPNAAAWQDLLVAESSQMDDLANLLTDSPHSDSPQPSEKIAVTHSLGCINWLVAARAGKFAQPFDRLVFVAPPDPALLQPVDGATLELSDPGWWDAIEANTRNFTLISSDQDRWQPRGLQATYLDHWPEVVPVIIEGAQHFSLDDGWGPWTGLAEWLTAAEPSPDQLLRR